MIGKNNTSPQTGGPICSRVKEGICGERTRWGMFMFYWFNHFREDTEAGKVCKPEAAGPINTKY